jgi:ketosteroid isomerase-like protein
MSTSPLETMTAMLEAIRTRDLAVITGSIDPSPETFVFAEGPGWLNTGGEKIQDGWRQYVESPVTLLHWEWREGPVEVSGSDQALVAGIIHYAFDIAGLHKELTMRMSWVLRLVDGSWKIVHEHGSQPLSDPYDLGEAIVG